MSKVTSKLQVTIPKLVADHFGIRPGDELDWVEAGDCIRIELPGKSKPSNATVEQRLAWYDQATRRQQQRDGAGVPAVTSEDRGWIREELYDRGRLG